ncbi:MAG: DNA polymerase III subunit delta [Thermodesulfobacteriota bacterium]|jgi:DNA polymerase-3 subunit delta
MPIYTYKDIPNILEQVEKGRPVSVYLIAGDSYLANEVHQQLVSRLLPEEQRSFNLEIIDGEKEDIHSILDRIQTFPFLPGRKVVSVKNPMQIFASGNEDRLVKRAEEAWQKGQPERCARILRALLPNAGISLNSIERGLLGNEKVIMEKLFPEKESSFPEWCKEALIYMQTKSYEESSALNPDQLLESAIRQGFPKDHILILVLEGPTGSKKIVKSIAEYGAVINLSLRQGKKGEQTAILKGFLKTRLSQEGKTILPQAEALLIERVGTETYLLEMEIQKLISFIGNRKQILPKDIIEIVGAFREEPLYELTAVLGERKLEEGLQKLKQLWEQGYNPLQILAGITNALRRLLLAGEVLKTISKTPPRVWQDFGSFSAKILPQLKQTPLPELLSKVHPFVLFNTLKTAQNFSLPQLATALKTLHETDRLLKTSGASPAFLLEDFIITFCKKS